MNRMLTVTLAMLVFAVAVLTIDRPWESTTAQSGPSLYVSVNELRFGWTPDLPDGGQGTFTGQLFGLLNSVPMHIVVEDPEHRTIAVRQVSGTIQDNDEEDWYRCDATFDMPLEESAFYRVFINDVYHSTIASHQLIGSGVIIILEAGSPGARRPDRFSVPGQGREIRGGITAMPDLRYRPGPIRECYAELASGRHDRICTQSTTMPRQMTPCMLSDPRE